jgi:hypothetical protein
MRLCRACRGWRVVHPPHEEMCQGATNTGSVLGTAPRCECDCTPASKKVELEQQYHYRSWLKLTHPIGPEDVGVKETQFPLDEEVHLTFRSDAHNTHVERLTHEAAEELTAQLVATRKGTRFLDTELIATYVAHAIRAGQAGGSIDEIAAELPMGLDRKVRTQLAEQITGGGQGG